MALKIRLRAGERLALNGAVIRNAGRTAIELDVLNEASLLRERDIMLPEEADTPLRRLYLALQLLHIEPGQRMVHMAGCRLALIEALAEAEAEGDAARHALLEPVAGEIDALDLVPALRRIQGVIGHPGEGRLARGGK